MKLKLTFCAAVAIVGLTIGALSPVLAYPVFCSPSFQGYRVCSGSGGYTSNEWSRDGTQFRAGQRRQALDDMAMDGHRDDHGHIA